MSIDKYIEMFKSNLEDERAQSNTYKEFLSMELVDLLTLLKQITESGNCNTCACRKDCNEAPELGRLVRYNCYKYEPASGDPLAMPKIGYWVENEDGTYTCTICETIHSKSKYCPNCGFPMSDESLSRTIPGVARDYYDD